MHVGFKIESLHFMVVPHMVKLFHKLLLHDAMLENWIWSTAELLAKFHIIYGEEIRLISNPTPHSSTLIFGSKTAPLDNSTLSDMLCVWLLEGL